MIRVKHLAFVSAFMLVAAACTPAPAASPTAAPAAPTAAPAAPKPTSAPAAAPTAAPKPAATTAPVAPKPTTAPAAKPSVSSPAASPAAKPAAAASPAAAGLGGLAAAPTMPKPSTVGAPLTVTIGYPSPSTSFLGMIVADKQGFFRDEGITAEISQVSPPVSVNAIANGSLDYTNAYGSTQRGAATGLPIRAVMVLTDKAADFMMVTSGINSISDLAGKTIGIDAVGATTDVETRETLRRAGFDISTTSIVTVGDEATRLQALLAGQVQAAMLGPQGRIQGEAAGLHSLYDVADYMQQPLGGLGTSVEKLEKNRNDVVRVARAILRGQQVVLKDKATAVSVMQEFLSLDADTASKTYDLTLKSWSTTGWIPDDVVTFDLGLARERGAEIPENVNLDTVRDFSIVKQILAEAGVR